MARKDDPPVDENAFYGQDFEQEGVVSVWVGLEAPRPGEEEVDVLQGMCGVGFYDLDQQEGNCRDFALVPLSELLSELSYAPTFVPQALAAARDLGLVEARWVIVQYDFAYDPRQAIGKVLPDPRFAGVFPYSTE